MYAWMSASMIELTIADHAFQSNPATDSKNHAADEIVLLLASLVYQ